MDQALQEAQERLLQKRVELNRTENPGQQIKNTDFQEIADRCIEKEKNTGRVYLILEEKTYSDKPEEELWFGKYSGISRLYKDCCFESYTGNDKLITGLKEISKTDQSIVLRGPTGCGKTHLAISIAKKQQNNQSIFITVPDLLLKIRSSFNGGKETEDEIIKEYSSTNLLILDDMGAEKTSEFAVTTLYIILDRRIRECLKTIITTNMSKEEIETTFGARIASRLAGMVNIKINMPDWRKKR